MYEELIEKLRHRGIEYNGISIFDEAAEAIEKLEAKNKELESKMHDSFTEHLLNQISRKEKQIDGLKAEKSKLEKELEQAKEEIELYKNTHYKLQYKGEELTASEVGKKLDELERVKAERDAAVEDLKSQYDIQGIEDDHPIYDMSICFKCIYYPSSFNRYCEDCNNFDKWQWRGVQGGKGND